MEWRVGESFPVDEPEPARLRLATEKGAKRPWPVLATWLLPLLFSYIAFGAYWLFALPITLAHVGERGWHSRRSALVALLLSPWALAWLTSFAGGVASFCWGGAEIQVYGLGKDPLVTVAKRVSGLRRTRAYADGSQILYEMPNNLAVRSMVRLFGPLENRHLDLIPDREEIRALIKDGEPLTTDPGGDDFLPANESAATARRSDRRSAVFALHALRRLDPAVFGKLPAAWCRSFPERDSCVYEPIIPEHWSCRLAGRGGTIVLGNERLVILISRHTARPIAYFSPIPLRDLRSAPKIEPIFCR